MCDYICILVCVKDTGKGIPQNTKEKIFDRFILKCRKDK